MTVEVTASKSEVTVGETFTISVKATGPEGTTYAFPVGASEDAFELSTPEPGSGASPRAGEAPPPQPGTHRYAAAVFALGEVEIPPIPVRYRLPDGTEGKVATEPVAIRVVSMLPRDPEEQKLADIHGPNVASLGPPYWLALARGLWFAVLGAVVIMAAILAWVFWLRRRGAEGLRILSQPEVPPDVEALRALAKLSASSFLARGEYRALYIRLTAIAKRYLERRLEAPVLEMTTAETLGFLRAHPNGDELLPVVRDLAEAADRIKFARGEGLRQEAERHLTAVGALVRTLEARLRPPARPAPGEEKAA